MNRLVEVLTLLSAEQLTWVVLNLLFATIFTVMVWTTHPTRYLRPVIRWKLTGIIVLILVVVLWTSIAEMLP